MGCKQELDMHMYTLVHMYTLFTLRLIAYITAKDHDYLHYTDVTSALDYKWTGVMDMETMLFN